MPVQILPVAPNPAPPTLSGIDQMPTEAATRRMRILFIHGMGVHQPCDADGLVDGLAQAMHLTAVSLKPEEIGVQCAHVAFGAPQIIPAPNATDVADLYRVDLKGTDRRVTFMYLLWSPLTAVPKNDIDEAGHPHRALTSNLAKDFMKSHLADVVLYAGTYKDVLRPALEYALCLFVEGKPVDGDPRYCNGGKSNIPTAIITHSLGGYMLMDTIADLAEPSSPHRVSPAQNVAYEVGLHLDQIFMLANQISLLDLSTRTSEQTGRDFSGAAIAPRFRRAWDTIQTGRQRGASDLPERQVLAISDPNDILSWELTDKSWQVQATGQTAPVVVANVYLGTTAEIPGLHHFPFLGTTALPPSAHTNYLQDADVLGIVGCGMTGTTINTCPP